MKEIDILIDETGCYFTITAESATEAINCAKHDIAEMHKLEETNNGRKTHGLYDVNDKLVDYIRFYGRVPAKATLKIMAERDLDKEVRVALVRPFEGMKIITASVNDEELKELLETEGLIKNRFWDPRRRIAVIAPDPDYGEYGEEADCLQGMDGVFVARGPFVLVGYTDNEYFSITEEIAKYYESRLYYVDKYYVFNCSDRDGAWYEI